MTASGWYVYGVVPAAEATDSLFDGVAGVAGTAVTLVHDGPLAAIASQVPLSDFGEEPIAENLRDPRWLEAGVRAHEAVLQAALRAAPVVPFRFGTIYRDEKHVEELLRGDPRLTEALERVRGRVELGVKGFLKSAAAESAEPSSGRGYLEQKQRARRLAEEQEAQRWRWADETHRRLAALAEAATASPLQPPEISGRSEEMFLNGAYLVSAEREREFTEAVAALGAELGPRGVTLELTGPWPPYNFVGESG